MHMQSAVSRSKRLRFVGRRVLLATCSCSVLALSVHAAAAETLINALVDAYSYNPQLDAQRAQLRATDEDVARAISGYRPSVNATADVGRESTRIRPDLGGTGGTTSPRGYSIQLVQPIFRGFRTTNAVNTAEAAVRAGRETLRDIEQQVLLQAVTAYANVVRDEAIAKLTQSSLDFLTTELKATKDRFAVGELTRTDVAQAEARRALGVSDHEVAVANLKSSKADYERVIGQPPRGLSEASANSALLPHTLPEAISIGTQENPQVVAALYQEQAARYQVDEVRGELLPEAQLEATFTERFDTSRQTEEIETASIVGRVNVPIYPGGGEVYARVRKTKQEHLVRIQQIEQARAAAQSQVAQAWSQLQGARAQRQANQAQIEANQTALNGVKEEEKVGQRTVLDVLDAQRELLNSQILLEGTKRNLVVNSYSVVSATGRLSIAELGAASTVYDPEAHYDEVRRKWRGIDITHDDGRREHLDLWGTRVEHAAPIK